MPGAQPLEPRERRSWPAHFFLYSRAALTTWGVCGLVVMALLFTSSSIVYNFILNLYSFGALESPFIDTSYVLAQSDCWRKGVNVYMENPCDILARPHDYAPLWLRIPLPDNSGTAVNLVGLGLDLMFLFSLAALPAPRKGHAVVLIFSLFSPVVVFAMERGNPDLLMFCLVVAAILAIERSDTRIRFVGYGSIVTAAMLKFYPLVAMVLVLREKLFRILVVSALVLVIFFASILWWWDEVQQMVPNIPKPLYFLDAFGMRQLPLGSAFFAAKSAALDVASLPVVLIYSVLEALALICLVVGVVVLLKRPSFRQAIRALNLREMDCLLSGSAIMVGCFFAGASTNYRAVFLLMILPSLIVLGLDTYDPKIKRLMRIVCVVAVGLLWFAPMQRLAYHYLGSISGAFLSGGAFMVWTFRELLWWLLMTVLAAVVMSSLLDRLGSNDIQDLLPKRLRQTSPPQLT